jgi:hypothetical protein
MRIERHAVTRKPQDPSSKADRNPRTEERDDRLCRRRSETGSAYITVLLALFALTILALAVAFVTETEMQLGNNERTLERVLTAADTGIQVATAKALVVPDNRPMRLELADPGPRNDVSVQNEVDVTPLRPILVTPCNLCMINQGSEFFKIDHAVTARVTRVVWSGTGPRPATPTPVARETVSVMIDFQPWQQTAQTFAQAIDADPSEIQF